MSENFSLGVARKHVVFCPAAMLKGVSSNQQKKGIRMNLLKHVDARQRNVLGGFTSALPLFWTQTQFAYTMESGGDKADDGLSVGSNTHHYSHSDPSRQSWVSHHHRGLPTSELRLRNVRG